MEVFLLLLLPAVVVLLWGFAGCQIFFPLEGPDPLLAPIDVVAKGISLNSIRVSWLNPNMGATTFRVERMGDSEVDSVVLDTSELTIEDGGLEEGTTYFYRVFAIQGDAESPDPGTAEGTTLAFTQAFVTSLNASQPTFEGFCVIQRIEPLKLEASGNVVRLTLHGSANGPLTIDTITMSRVAGGGDRYDAAGDLTVVATSVAIPPDVIMTLDAVSYDLDRQQPLLIAFDVSPIANQGNVRLRAGVQSDEAAVFIKAGRADATVPDRVPTAAVPNDQYTELDRIYIIEKIEVVPNAQ